MEGPSAERTTIDIGATASQHGHLLSQLPAAHALSGCGNVAQCFGAGKSTVIKILVNGVELHKLGILSADTGDTIEEATAFMAACYSVKSLVTLNMSEVRGEVWVHRTNRTNVTKASELKSIPPSIEAFEENVKRAHIQTAIWKSALNSEPPALDPVEFGRESDERTRCSIPVSLQPNVSVRSSTGSAGNDKVWLCHRYTLFNSNVRMLYSSLVMHNVLWMSRRSSLPE